MSGWIVSGQKRIHRKGYSATLDASGNLMELRESVSGRNLLLPSELAEIGAYTDFSGSAAEADAPADYENVDQDTTLNFSAGSCRDSTGQVVIECPNTWKRLIPSGDPAGDYLVGPNGTMMHDGQPMTPATTYGIYVVDGPGNNPDYMCFPIGATIELHSGFQVYRRIGYLCSDQAGRPVQLRSINGDVTFKRPYEFAAEGVDSDEMRVHSIMAPPERLAKLSISYTYTGTSQDNGFAVREMWQDDDDIRSHTGGYQSAGSVYPNSGQRWTWHHGDYRLDDQQRFRIRFGRAAGQSFAGYLRGWIDDFRRGV